MIAQANRRPQHRQERRRRHVDGVEILRGDAHRVAFVIVPQMRDKRADLVEDVHARGDDQRDRHHPQRKHTRRNQHDQRDRPDAACSLKPQPQPRRLALRHTTPEGGVDRQRRIALDQYTVHPRHHQRQRGQDAIAHDQRERRQDRGQNEQRQRPWLHRRERQIFGILARAIARARVVEVVDAFIHEARHQ